ncbi:unnamed protein product [Amoebophrya sp. A120]|nr:unnamed protein product [Amoebophrya sp. A120]|eukprot:GSA120T00018594001.1
MPEYWPWGYEEDLFERRAAIMFSSRLNSKLSNRVAGPAETDKQYQHQITRDVPRAKKKPKFSFRDRKNSSDEDSEAEDETNDPLTAASRGSTTTKPQKIRRIAHVEGHYATFAFFDCADLPWLPFMQRQCAKRLQDAQGPDGDLVGRIENPHISVSPLVMIRYQFIDTLINRAKELVKKHTKGPFTVQFHPKGDIFANMDHNRWFGALPLKGQQGIDQVTRYSMILERMFEHYDATDHTQPLEKGQTNIETQIEKASTVQPALWKEPRPHLSLAWCLTQPENLPTGGGHADFGPNCWPGILGDLPVPVTEGDGLEMKVDTLVVQVGNRFTKIPL